MAHDRQALEHARADFAHDCVVLGKALGALFELAPDSRDIGVDTRG
jgi:hypothetical protein